MTPDPYKASAGPADPGSWNPYVYTRSDPVNRFDPRGLCDQSGDTDYSVTVCGGGDPFVGDVADPQAGSSSTHADTDPVDPVTRFHELSDDCQQGLKDAMKGPDNRGSDHSRLSAMNGAEDAKDVLVKAADKYGIDWTLLAAIGVIESHFTKGNEQDGAGVGVGYFQITVAPGSGVTAEQASNLAWAADYAANKLASNMQDLAAKFPNFTSYQLLQATAASWNLGPGGISGNPNTIDVGTTPDGHYGRNALELMSCFH